MATSEDAVTRPSEERKVRIDHSAVYLENDRLAEELVNVQEFLSRKRCRQAINRDQEIKELRQSLNSLQLHKSISAVLSLRPHTSPGPAPRLGSSRRLQTPPVIVKLDVKVPSKNDGFCDDKDYQSSEDESESSASTGDSDEDPETRAEKIRRRQQRRRMRLPSSALKDRRANLDVPHDRGNATMNGGAKKVTDPLMTRQRLLLNRLDMEAIPAKWYTEVHHPADIPIRRASSAHPAFRSSHATTATRQSKSTSSSRSRRRRAATALPASRAHVQEETSESTIFCGSKHNHHQQQQHQKDVLSRRQIMELTAVSKNSRPGSGLDQHRNQYLEAVRLERERLEAKVKTFLGSCDRISSGGLISTRQNRAYHSIGLPDSFYV